MKTRNFLTNISFRWLNKNDHAKISFVLDCISFIVQNFNLFSSEHKFNSQTDQHYVNIWKKCLPKSLYKFICCKENVMVLNQLHVTYQKATKIVEKYVHKEKETSKLHSVFDNTSWFTNTCTAYYFRKILLWTRNTELKIGPTLRSAIKNGSILKWKAIHQLLTNWQNCLRVLKTG